MDQIATDESERRRRRTHDHTKLGIAIVTASTTLVFGVVSFMYQRTLTGIDEERHTAEINERKATNFVMAYFESTCAERAEMMADPLDRWFNWRKEDRLRTYSREGSPNIHIPVTTEDPETAVMGSVQYRTQMQSFDGQRSELILEAISDGYELNAAEPIQATSKEPVVSHCQKRRSEQRERVELEVPTQVRDVTPLDDHGRLRILVDTIADRDGQDQVGDKSMTYSMVVAADGDDWELTSIAGIETSDGHDE